MSWLDRLMRWLRKPQRTDWRHGDIVLPREVLRLHSETVAEDGRVLQLFDLPGGRTGARAFAPGTRPADRPPITVCD